MVGQPRQSGGGFNEYVLPVDDFFDDYLNALTGNDADFLMQDDAEDPNTGSNRVPAQDNGHAGRPQAPGATAGPPGADPGPYSLPEPGNIGRQVAEQFGNQLGGGAVTMGDGTAVQVTHLPNIVNPAFQQSWLPLASVSGKEEAGGGAHAEAAASGEDGTAKSKRRSSVSTPAEDDPDSGAGSGRGKRARTAKQQLLNRQAQQRYRQRKKEKAAQMAQAVDELQLRVEELQRANAEAAAAKAKLREMEALLVEKDAQLQALKLDSSSNWGSGVSTGRGGRPPNDGTNEAASKPQEGDRGSGGCVPAPQPRLTNMPEEEQGFKCCERLEQLFSTQVESLKEFWREQDLDSVPTLTDQQLVSRLSAQIDNICTTCMYATRALACMEGVDVAKLMSGATNPVLSGQVPTDRARKALWVSVVRSLDLSEQQIDAMMSARGKHLTRLAAVYKQRQSLNAAAIVQLAPNSVKGPAEAAQEGLLDRQKENASVARVLSELKENLKDEQKAASELEFVTFKSLLTPMQGARVIKDAYPFHCDCLALLNTVACVHNREATSYCEGAAEAHTAA
ncbi:unnamed protein product [Pedinophyceae sp. YPF-701]|nr:unnamed protein product [Pedinophyceae sp. YPF-701]